jgi:hypothetical protein
VGTRRALDGGEYSVSRHGLFIPGERFPGSHWLGGWVAPMPGEREPVITDDDNDDSNNNN